MPTCGNLRAKVSQFGRLLERDARHRHGRGADARVGRQDAVDVLPHLRRCEKVRRRGCAQVVSCEGAQVRARWVENVRGFGSGCLNGTRCSGLNRVPFTSPPSAHTCTSS
eukprot:5713650-Prymnesium_polylepis.1